MSSLPDAIADLEALRDLAPPADGQLRCVVGDGVADVAIDAPATRGAMTVSMMAELGTAVIRLRADPPALVVLRGGEGTFCSGGHLRQLLALSERPGAAERMAKAMTCVLDALRSLPSLVVCAVDGPAIGGGVELALAADLLLTTPRARFDFVQVRLGIGPGWGGGRWLAERWGRSRALRTWLLAPTLDAEAASAEGLTDGSIVGGTIGHVTVWLDQSAAGDAESRRLAKISLAATDHERFGRRFGSAEHRARLGLR